MRKIYLSRKCKRYQFFFFHACPKTPPIVPWDWPASLSPIDQLGNVLIYISVTFISRNCRFNKDSISEHLVNVNKLLGNGFA